MSRHSDTDKQNITESQVMMTSSRRGDQPTTLFTWTHSVNWKPDTNAV